jgi:hypothetical protein
MIMWSRKKIYQIATETAVIKKRKILWKFEKENKQWSKKTTTNIYLFMRPPAVVYNLKNKQKNSMKVRQIVVRRCNIELY